MQERPDELYARIADLERRNEALERANKALLEDSARLKRLLDGAEEAFWDWDLETQNFVVSHKFEPMLGYEPGEIDVSPSKWGDHVHPEDLANALDSIDLHLRGLRPNHEVEVRCFTKSGAYKYILTRGRVVSRDAGGKPTMMAGTFTDIHARKQAEEALRASEQRYRSLFSNMTEGFTVGEPVFDDQGRPVDYRFLEANEAFFQETGLSPAVLGRPLREVLPQLEQAWVDAYAKVAQTGEPIRFEHYNTDTRHYYDTFAFCPSPGRFAVVGRNVTEKKRLELALQESEARARTLFEQAAVGLAYISLDGYPIRCNEKFCAIMGYSQAELAQLNFRDVSLPEELEEEDKKAAQLLSGAIDSCAVEKRYIRKDGTVIWANLTVSLARKANGEPDYLIAVLEDIQHRKDMELALAEERQARHTILEREVAERTAELQAANRELEAFTFATSHDLRGPLGRINSFCALLEQRYRKRLDGDGLQFLNFISQNALRLSCLVDNLLSHAQVAQQALDLEPLQLRAVAQSVLRERVEEILERGATIHLDLPEVAIMGNSFAVAQALSNLLENALKYSAPVKDPTIEIGGKERDGKFLMWIRDNGIGFDMAYREKIFEMFRRLHTYSEYTGTGIGLALVKRAMERMDGKVWAESEPGRGAIFYLEFRLAGNRLGA